MKLTELNLEQFKIPQNFGSEVATKKVITSIQIKKPNKHSFIRVMSENGIPMNFDCLMLEYKEGVGTDTYFVTPEIAEEISSEMVPKRIYVAIDRQNNFFLWSVRLPDAEGKLDQWNEAAHEAAKLAAKSWIRISANMSAGCYDVHEAIGSLKDPEWPTMPLEEMLNLAFKGKVIDSMEHPIIQKLKGAV